MSLETQIKQRLAQALSPSVLQVVNESALHHGHAGDDGSGESHWRVVIASKVLEPLTRLQRHRAIHEAIGADIMRRIHALSIDVHTADVQA